MQMTHMIICGGLILCVDYLAAQSDSTLLTYYPLQIGNHWEYEEKFEDLLEDSAASTYFSLEVIGDTVMPNKKRYQVLLKKSIPETIPPECLYERIDSTSFNVFRYDIDEADEVWLDSLGLIITGGSFSGISRGTNLPAGISYLNSSMDTILNYPTNLQHFSANDLAWVYPFEYWLAKDIGLVQALLRDTTWRDSIILNYAEIQGENYGTPVAVRQSTKKVERFRLLQNFPNPFNPSTTIEFELAKSGEFELNLYNLQGQKIKSILKGFRTSGLHKVDFEAKNLASGVYIYQLKSENLSKTKKLVVIK